MSLAGFLGMGGYAIYVWPCYGLAALVIGLNILAARGSLRRAQQAARRRLATAAGGAGGAVP
jgi:heme exporter protein CcmD